MYASHLKKNKEIKHESCYLAGSLLLLPAPSPRPPQERTAILNVVLIILVLYFIILANGSASLNNTYACCNFYRSEIKLYSTGEKSRCHTHSIRGITFTGPMA